MEKTQLRLTEHTKAAFKAGTKGLQRLIEIGTGYTGVMVCFYFVYKFFRSSFYKLWISWRMFLVFVFVFVYNSL